MTTALKKVQTDQPTSLFPNEAEWNMLKEQAKMVVTTGFLPSAINTPEKAIAIALKGRELGVPPMHAFSHIHIIQGKPTISSELMASLIYKNCPGAVMNYLENSNKSCVIEASRPGHKPARFSYTIEDARNAGLLNKQTWRDYPAAMLRARAISIVGRAVFPDAIMGCSYTPEELGAEVNEDGRVIEIPHENTQPTQKLPQPLVKPLSSPEVKAPTRESIGAEIIKASRELNITNVEAQEWAKEFSGVVTSQMTLAQMEDFLEMLQSEIGRKGSNYEQG